MGPCCSHCSGASSRDWELHHPRGGTPEDLRQLRRILVHRLRADAAHDAPGPAAGPGCRRDRRRASAEDPALPAGQPALEPRDHAGQAGRPAGARRDLRGPGTAGGRPAVALGGGLDPRKVLTIYLGTFTTVLSVSGLSMFVSVPARCPRDAILAPYRPRGDLAARPAGHRPRSPGTSVAR